MRHTSIINTHPSVVTLIGDIGTDINGDVVVLDETLITIESKRLQAEYNTKQYQRDRVYPTIEEQLDYIYHNGIEAWKVDVIKPIKDAYPK